MKVSICVPAYGNADGIKRLLDSVRVQKYTDYEIVITDDSKTDEVSELVAKYLELHDDFADRITYSKNETRLGAGNNWNRSIDIASGEYIKIMHHDDWFSSEESLGEFVRMLDDNPKAQIAFSGTNQVDIGTGDSYSRCISDTDLEELKKDYRYLYIAQVIGAPSATIYRKTDIRFAPDLSWLIDAEFYMKVFKQSSDDNGYSSELFTYSLDPLISIGVSSTQLTEAVRDDVKVNLFEYDFVMKEFDLAGEEPFASKMKSVEEKANWKYKYVSTGRMIKEKLRNLDLKYIGKLSFYIGLTIELLVLILEKSSYINPIESWMFRISFVFFVIKCICTKYTPRDWTFIAILGIVSIISYRINTKDELVRIAVFVVAMKDMDLKRTLKYVFWVSSIGMAVLMLLSLLGVLGTIVDPGDGYGFKAGSTRLCLGLGSANTLSIMVWALMSLGIYLYYEKMKWWHYALLLVLSGAVYIATLTRTSLVTMVLTIVIAFAISRSKTLQRSKTLYTLGGGMIGVFVGFSVWAAKVSNWKEFMTPFQNKINLILTGRIESISRWTNGGGVLENWLLFSNPDFEEYFDMGYVRMFFWYGIIPASIMIILMLYMIYESYKRKDYMGFILIMIFAFFTVFEAHIVSVYIARNYLLFLAGTYIFTARSTSLRTESSK